MALHPAFQSAFQSERFLPISLLTSALFLLFGDGWIGQGAGSVLLAGMFVWLFVTVLGSALAVVRHADCLAIRLGEPYGTLVLTLAVTGIEVMLIASMMLHGDNNPTAARDTMFAVIMIVLNGMVGIALLLGGLLHREQQYNLQGANAYLGVIIPLGAFGLIFPNYTVTTAGPTLSTWQEVFLVLMSVALYSSFLAVQTTRHRNYFTGMGGGEEEGHHDLEPRSVTFHSALLIAYMVPVVYLAEKLALPLDIGIEKLGAPAAIAGLVVAVLVATPEALGAVKAARRNQMQRSVNIFLGSVLATTGLTIPVVVAVSLMTGNSITLGLEHTDLVLLELTFVVSIITFSSGRTNVLQGAVHLLLFLAYVLLIFEG